MLQTNDSISALDSAGQRAHMESYEAAAPAVAAKVEHWPFTVRVARSDADLAKVLAIRHAAYARHLPDALSQPLACPEALDRAEGVALLLAESKIDGSPMGTLRIQNNRYQPLALEQSIELPTWMQGVPLAEVTRLGVRPEDSARLVKFALFKGFYLYCLQEGIRHMVITARAPLDRMYERMLFVDVYPHLGYIPLPHVFNLPHRVLYRDVDNVRQQGLACAHPLTDFMCHTRHPDLRL